MTTIPFEPNRFRSTAAYYTRYRVPYPDALIERIADRAKLRPGGRLLDLGCGPGQLGIAFARLTGAEVIGLDPEPEMLAAAAEDARQANVAITLRQGSSYDLEPDLGRLHMTVMGRSFHWMDRTATLEALDRLIEPGGSVVLFHDRHISSTPDWRSVVNQLAETYSPEKNADRERRRSPDWIPHEAVLMRSPFCDLERIGVLRERELDIDDIVGRAYSTSVTSPQALGDRAEDFEAALRAELLRLAPEGRLTEIVEVNGLIAFRG
ncbi:methyltransferase domain-containing protein [Rhizobium sp. BK251]|uniref:class I SAM-dependent methyltransferase n=1 Tax=Rhizobium sp. BK251 TaxID=2512125 RepID=UPI0010503B3C|nr:methyltransferase domain-containing protein [Rhizobium sp. BK251]TCL72630.1 methyltransferase family protein [Rhizobium sp. BK251]